MIYDVSFLIKPNMQVYKNKKEKMPKINIILTHESDGIYESQLTINLHTGTHIDYPLHMIKRGATSNVEELENLITDVKVFDVSYLTDGIDLYTLKKFDIKENDFILFKTKNSFSEEILSDFTYLKADAAKYLKDKLIKGVGIDGLSIERLQKNHPTHKILLQNGITIIEGLRLKQVKQKIYKMICLPLKIYNVEATPARIILIDK